MQRLILFSDDFQTIETTRRMIEKNFNNPIEIAMDEPGLRAQLDSKNFSLGMFRTPQLDEKLRLTLTRMRKLGYGFPFLVACEKSLSESQKKLELENEIHALIGPPTEKSLMGLTRKLLIARRVPRQFFPRFNTNVIAQIEPLASGNPLLTCMYNLSQGGAYCEFDSKDPVAVGDLIKFQVNLDDTKSGYVLNGKVVWTTPKGRFTGRFGCGFKFVSAQEAYRALISKL
jgi:hypothetical protein